MQRRQGDAEDDGPQGQAVHDALEPPHAEPFGDNG